MIHFKNNIQASNNYPAKDGKSFRHSVRTTTKLLAPPVVEGSCFSVFLDVCNIKNQHDAQFDITARQGQHVRSDTVYD